MTHRSTPLPRRKGSIRHPGHDYREPGVYFVTICTQRRLPLFGRVHDEVMHPNAVARMVAGVWGDLPERFPGLGLDAMIVMPDHLHGIVMLGTDPAITSLPSLGDVVRFFKGQSTLRYFEQVRAGMWPPVDRRLWQQKYFDRIVRNDRELDAYRAYIEGNPARWLERHQP